MGEAQTKMHSNQTQKEMELLSVFINYISSFSIESLGIH